MCGIIGITSNKLVSSPIINSLKKLEYRGYDSAGIATIDDGLIKEVKYRPSFSFKCFCYNNNRCYWFFVIPWLGILLFSKLNIIN